MSLCQKLGVLLLFTSLTYAQEVNYENQTYLVKGDKVLRSGVDITKMLTIEKRKTILRRASKPRRNILKKRSNISTNKKSKKELSILTNIDEASKNLKDAYSGYGKLKREGNLSRKEETTWLEKIEKLKVKLARAKAKLK